MNFEKKRTFYVSAGISSFVFAGLTFIFCMMLVLFPDVIAAFSDSDFWVYLTTNLRLFVVIWLLVSVVLQIACGVFFVFLKTEERFEKFKILHIAAVVATAVFGFFVTLGILVAGMIVPNLPTSLPPEETLE